MTEVTVQDVASIQRIDHDEAMRITAVENGKFADQLDSLSGADWTRSTDCTLWDVRALAAHVVGSTAGQASPREFVRQVRQGRPLREEIGGAYWWDGMNELQVRERAGLSVDELREEWRTGSARALEARKKLPRPIAALPLLNLPVVGRQPVRYLFDIGFTRDVFAHRVDIATATGRTFDADGEHDGRIVEDLVAEWATTHGEPFELVLTGPAGGSYRSGADGDRVEMDAIDFVRVIAGRATGSGVMRHPLPL